MIAKHLSPSKKALWILCFIIAVIRLLLPYENVLTWDVFGYYLYLPAKFIYHDLGLTDMTWLKSIMTEYTPSSTLYQVNILADGHGAMRYPCGIALLNSPFFFIAHAWAHLFHFAPDGFSTPYMVCYALGGIFYSIIGLIYFRKILVHFFDEKVATLTFILIVAGTNYFEQATLQNSLTHHFLFTLYAILIYNTIRWHADFKKQNAWMIGLSLGLITTTRPNEMVSVLIPLLWNIYNKESIQQKLRSIAQYPAGPLCAMAGLILALLPQLLYWKIYTGQWFYYSYDDPGVGFEFAHPYLFQFLFSFRKGWFLYTPLMLVAVLGFYYLYKKNKSIFVPTFIFFLLNLYIICSWSVWWYAGGSFSSRSIVSSYGVLALPLGYLISVNKRRWLYILLGLLVVLNLFQTWQSYAGILSNDRMTKAYYFRIFGKIKPSEKDKKLLLTWRSGETQETMPTDITFTSSVLQSLDFEGKSDINHLTDTLSYKGKKALVMDSSFIFTPAFKIPYAQITDKEYAWVRISAWVYVPSQYSGEQLPMIVASFSNRKDESYKYRTSTEDIKPADRGKWLKIQMEYMTPEVRNENDVLNIYLWYRGKQPVFVDDFLIEKFEPESNTSE